VVRPRARWRGLDVSRGFGAVVVDDVPEAVGVGSAVAREQDGIGCAGHGAPCCETLANVDVGSRQLSKTELQLVPLVGAEAVANTPCAWLSEP
jgi:hypothetical protein